MEVAEKHISLRKTLKELKNSKLPSDGVEDLEKSIAATIKNTCDEAIESTFTQIELKVPTERVNELKIEISRQSLRVVADISTGARVFVSLESQQQIELLAEKSTIDIEEIRSKIEQQKQIEAKLDNLALGYSERVPELEKR